MFFYQDSFPKTQSNLRKKQKDSTPQLSQNTRRHTKKQFKQTPSNLFKLQVCYKSVTHGDLAHSVTDSAPLYWYGSVRRYFGFYSIIFQSKVCTIKPDIIKPPFLPITKSSTPLPSNLLTLVTMLIERPFDSMQFPHSRPEPRPSTLV